ncbi:hypothetical protein [Rhodococcus sp. JS3073]|uniref:hypothetical protein n=1 Tax=Rhodococcus sp. JS3073 TaxID=3002901 RepID=UPI002285F5C5|nr:hypothetical protein [Rhodococcus sp. JS3073]WAM19704.1 hypothetical protein OYT95_39295 [Rhodococcus sp. JS3073]
MRSPIVDQAALRWRIRRDLTGLTLENALAGTGTTREAERHLAPWLKQAAAALDTPMSIEGLEDIAAQWRGRRAPYLLANPRLGRRAHRPAGSPYTPVLVVETHPRRGTPPAR